MAAERQIRPHRAARAVGISYVLLFVFSVPWYWPSGYGEQLIAGFPLWCLISLGCYVATATLTLATIDTIWTSGSGSPAESDRFRE
jgi:hypothetical protein